MEYDVFLADCPARTTLSLIGDGWSVVVIIALDERPRRNSELADRIGGVSGKVLNDTLGRLVANGLVDREPLATFPPGVRYRLTALGESLVPPVRALAEWAELHAGAIPTRWPQQRSPARRTRGGS